MDAKVWVWRLPWAQNPDTIKEVWDVPETAFHKVFDWLELLRHDPPQPSMITIAWEGYEWEWTRLPTCTGDWRYDDEEDEGDDDWCYEDEEEKARKKNLTPGDP